MEIPSIRIDDDVDMCVYFCFMLDSFGELGDCVISEIVLSLESVNYFELMSQVGVMQEKKLITVRNDKKKGERVYSLLPEGKTLAEELKSRIPLSIREKTLETGKEVIERIEREKSVRCYIDYDYTRDRYDLNVKFLNELNGDIILNIKLYAPDEEKAKEMKERFLSKPSLIITRTMNMFLKDDFFMYDK
ncbi:MAG: DUF4364 family protein [Ruminiclostridium sp.]